MQSFAKTLETLSHLQGDKKPVLAQQFLQLASELRVATHPDQVRKVRHISRSFTLLERRQGRGGGQLVTYRSGRLV